MGVERGIVANPCKVSSFQKYQKKREKTVLQIYLVVPSLSPPSTFFYKYVSYIKVLNPSPVVFYCDSNSGSLPQRSQVTFGPSFTTQVYTRNLFLAGS